MIDKVGIFRSGDELDEAVEELQQLLIRSRDTGLSSNIHGANPELVATYRLPKMLRVALCVAGGARKRTESRGAHSLEDYPQREDHNCLKRTLTAWKGEDNTLSDIDYEPLDVRAMEMPPGSRGYGNAIQIDHPDTAERKVEVEAIRERLKHADRFEVQKRR